MQTGTAVSFNLRALPSKLVDGGKKKWNDEPQFWHAILLLQVLLEALSEKINKSYNTI